MISLRSVSGYLVILLFTCSIAFAQEKKEKQSDKGSKKDLKNEVLTSKSANQSEKKDKNSKSYSTKKDNQVSSVSDKSKESFEIEVIQNPKEIRKNRKLILQQEFGDDDDDDDDDNDNDDKEKKDKKDKKENKGKKKQ